MKLWWLNQRKSLAVMTFRLSIATILLFLLPSVKLKGEKVEPTSDLRYQTPAVTNQIDAKGFTNFSFTSSSYLGGKLTIKSSSRNKPVVSYRKVLKAGSRSDAEEFADFIYLNIEELESELSISAETKSYPPWSGTSYSGRIEVEIEVPKNEQLKIYVRTTVYDIDVTGPFATLDINNVVGTVNVRGITSKVKVTSDNSEVKISECSGPITVKTSMRPLSLIDIDSRLGTIKLRNVNGDINLRKIKGEIDARTELASITGDDIDFATGRSVLRTENSTLELEAVAINGDVDLVNSNGRTEFTIPDNSSAVYSLKVQEGGRIYTKDLLLKADVVGRTLLTGSTGSGKNRIDIDMRGVGTINLNGKATGSRSR